LRKLKNGSVIGSLFVVILGCFLHYAYELSGNNQFVGLFASVNESVWEHLKLLVMPYLLFVGCEWIIHGRNYPGLLASRTCSLLCGICFLLTMFYTYSGILGAHLFFIDILIFFLSVLISFVVSCKFMEKRIFDVTKQDFIAFLFLVILILCFWSFSFMPPEMGLFSVPK